VEYRGLVLDKQTIILEESGQLDKLVATPARPTPSVLATTPPSAAYSILSRHRQRKAQESLTEAKSVVSMAIPDFLKRFTRQNTAKM